MVGRFQCSFEASFLLPLSVEVGAKATSTTSVNLQWTCTFFGLATVHVVYDAKVPKGRFDLSSHMYVAHSLLRIAAHSSFVDRVFGAMPVGTEWRVVRSDAKMREEADLQSAQVNAQIAVGEVTGTAWGCLD